MRRNEIQTDGHGTYRHGTYVWTDMGNNICHPIFNGRDIKIVTTYDFLLLDTILMHSKT